MTDIPYKALLFDLEVSPYLCWAYQMWDAKILKIEKPQVIMSCSLKWYGKKEIITKGLWDFPNWKKDRWDDSALVEWIREYAKGADILVAHNLRKFDFKKLNTRIGANSLGPIKESTLVDTLQIAKSKFSFPSNSLENLSVSLGGPKKLEKKHGDLWYDCLMNDDEKAKKNMLLYNRQDVVVLEYIFKKLIPYMDRFPKVWNSAGCCPECGSTNIKKNGVKYHKSSWTQRFACVSCGFPNIYGPANSYDDSREI